MKTVAFVCVHNSCRSQIAEALAKKFGQGVLEPYSAGTQQVNQINQDAVRIIRERYDIDMEVDQYSKLIDELPEVDYLITMGCNVECPFLPFRVRREDWGLDDPSGQSDKAFHEVIDRIEMKMRNLVEEIQKSEQ